MKARRRRLANLRHKHHGRVCGQVSRHNDWHRTLKSAEKESTLATDMVISVVPDTGHADYYVFISGRDMHPSAKAAFKNGIRYVQAN